ncbi:DUF6111 family protein [Chelatococcus asaccharovorans]|uniref:DUF6111 family protein n=1 Tax=Chelatococcus asaccharovorans TaxID=28210 RepID=UPI00224C66B6|nr:DUF6111 family protein [Chelatococcus asaccharovorans]CAH1663630.1 conserved hypothetical protein [Chelatococcus asaccharovorans]CAH1682746.1 conserved hypothetical protein [Chelatococcus asaccharovorans]
MTRALFEGLVLFLAPFALFALYLGARRRNPFTRQAWDGHVHWLVLTGLVVVIASFVYIGLVAERSTGAWVPTHLKDGVLVPGHFE